MPRRPLGAGAIPLPSMPRITNKKKKDDSRNWFRFDDSFVGAGDTPDTTKVFIYDEIGMWGTDASEFVQQLMQITTPNIELHLNSPGGGIFHGVAIYNALLSHPSNVNVIVDALAASAASFIAQAGDSVTMTKGSTMMIHDGSGSVYGNASDMQQMASILDKLSDNIASIYADRAGGDTADWRGMMQEETWYNAQEAVDAGLADAVQGVAEEDPEDKWDFTKFFNHAGRDDAPSPQEVADAVKAKKEIPVAPEADDKNKTVPAPAPVTAPTLATPLAVMCGGSVLNDQAAVQAYITGIETENKTFKSVQDEAAKATRKTFVSQLVKDNKLLAPQEAATAEWALGLDDAQFDGWKAQQEAAPTQQLLGQHGQGTQGGTKPAVAIDPSDQHYSDVKARVDMLKKSNLPAGALEKTESYIELQQLNAARASQA